MLVCHGQGAPLYPSADGGWGQGRAENQSRVTGHGDRSCWRVEAQGSGPSVQRGAHRPRLLPQVLPEGGLLSRSDNQTQISQVEDSGSQGLLVAWLGLVH